MTHASYASPSASIASFAKPRALAASPVFNASFAALSVFIKLALALIVLRRAARRFARAPPSRSSARNRPARVDAASLDDYHPNSVCTDMYAHATLTHGDRRSPTRAAFQKTPRNPVR